MKRVKLILMAGRTGVGKSTVAEAVAQNLGTHRIKSYTTRPMRPGEDESSDHYFITPEEVEQYRDDIAAYTKIGKYEYFTTWEMLKNSDGCIYVIDPIGIYYLMQAAQSAGFGNLFDFKIVYVTANKRAQRERLEARGDADDVIEDRMAAEDEQFSAFEEKERNNPQVIWVDNSNSVKESVDYVMQRL